ncbi:hypothetical protein [Turneriella parva]|uniref:hypothetical protein n=1 Tax=Turneriella parva TaxID=29510 RepID=UPI0012F6556B|nr:hypothetical protein [Turneriella parva]
MRILIGFIEIAGYHGALERGFRQLGHTCNFYEFRAHPFGYANRKRPLLSRTIIQLLELRKRYDSGFVGVPITIARLLVQLLFFLYASMRYEVFIFGFGSTFFTPITPSLERLRYFGARFLVRIGKRVIFLMQGSDARPPFMDGTYQNLPVEEIVALNRAKKRDIQTLEATGATVVCDRAISAYFTRPVVDRSFILCPVNTANAHRSTPPAKQKKAKGRRTITILHAPSAPELKGSDRIREVIQRIRIPGIRLEFTEIRNKTNQEVMAAISDCDIVIDQLYSDIVLPVFPTEAGWLGKPAVIGIYDKRFVFAGIPAEEIPPAWYIDPENLETELKRILRLSAGAIAKRGEAMQRFVARKATDVHVAQKFTKIINKATPPEWYYNPEQYSYINGCVIREQKLYSIIGSIAHKYSLAALFMNDKKDYIARLKAAGIYSDIHETR